MEWAGRVMLLAAHPDDEVIGAGGQFANMRDLWIVHATDGAPANMFDARKHGFSSGEEYAQARRNELTSALKIAGIGPARALGLDFVGQQTVFHLTELSDCVLEYMRDIRPDTILSPSYEGGHPDHDSLCFAVHQALRLIARSGGKIPEPLEYALYHARVGQLETGCFLEENGGPGESELLDPEACARKRSMLDCFVTQREVLAQFPPRRECFRRAPEYDFLRPPHSGRLYYENFDWGTTGEHWRKRANDAMSRLSIQ